MTEEQWLREVDLQGLIESTERLQGLVTALTEALGAAQVGDGLSRGADDALNSLTVLRDRLKEQEVPASPGSQASPPSAVSAEEVGDRLVSALETVRTLASEFGQVDGALAGLVSAVTDAVAKENLAETARALKDNAAAYAQARSAAERLTRELRGRQSSTGEELPLTDEEAGDVYGSKVTSYLRGLIDSINREVSTVLDPTSAVNVDYGEAVRRQVALNEVNDVARAVRLNARNEGALYELLGLSAKAAANAYATVTSADPQAVLESINRVAKAAEAAARVAGTRPADLPLATLQGIVAGVAALGDGVRRAEARFVQDARASALELRNRLASLKDAPASVSERHAGARAYLDKVALPTTDLTLVTGGKAFDAARDALVRGTTGNRAVRKALADEGFGSGDDRQLQVLSSTVNSALTRSAHATLNASRTLREDLGPVDLKAPARTERGALTRVQNDLRQQLSNVVAAINAQRLIDPEGKALKDLEALYRSLQEEARSVEDALSPTVLSQLSDALKDGYRGFTGLIRRMLGVMGLSTLTNVGGYARGVFSVYDRFRIEHYENALVDQGVGAGISSANTRDLLEFGRELFRDTGGMVSVTEATSTYRGLVRSVGGHYGGTGTEARDDMARLTKALLPAAKVHGLSQGDLEGMAKTFYKDLDYDVNQTAEAVEQVIAAAQENQVPIGQYARLMTSLVNSLRDFGVPAKVVMGTMNRLMDSGLRVEDAASFTKSIAQAKLKWSDSWTSGNAVVFGYMAGLGRSPFQNILTAGLTHYVNDEGKTVVNEDRYRAMGKMMYTKYSFINQVSGGNTDVGWANTFKTMMSDGFDRRQASVMVQKMRAGKGEDIADLLRGFEEEDEAKQTKKPDALNEARKALKASGDQLAETKKMLADRQEALHELEKALELLEPILAGLENIERELLGGLVEKVGELMVFAKKVLENPFVKEVGGLLADTAIEHPIVTGLALALGPGKVTMLALRGLKRLVGTTRFTLGAAARLLRWVGNTVARGGRGRAAVVGTALVSAAALLGGGKAEAAEVHDEPEEAVDRSTVVPPEAPKRPSSVVDAINGTLEGLFGSWKAVFTGVNFDLGKVVGGRVDPVVLPLKLPKEARPASLVLGDEPKNPNGPLGVSVPAAVAGAAGAGYLLRRYARPTGKAGKAASALGALAAGVGLGEIVSDKGYPQHPYDAPVTPVTPANPQGDDDANAQRRRAAATQAVADLAGTKSKLQSYLRASGSERGDYVAHALAWLEETDAYDVNVMNLLKSDTEQGRLLRELMLQYGVDSTRITERQNAILQVMFEALGKAHLTLAQTVAAAASAARTSADYQSDVRYTAITGLSLEMTIPTEVTERLMAEAKGQILGTTEGYDPWYYRMVTLQRAYNDLYKKKDRTEEETRLMNRLSGLTYYAAMKYGKLPSGRAYSSREFMADVLETARLDLEGEKKTEGKKLPAFLEAVSHMMDEADRQGLGLSVEDDDKDENAKVLEIVEAYEKFFDDDRNLQQLADLRFAHKREDYVEEHRAELEAQARERAAGRDAAVADGDTSVRDGGTGGAYAAMPAEYRAYVNKYAAMYNVDPRLMAAMQMAESNFNPNAVSEAGAIGLAQLMPGTAESLGFSPEEMYDPEKATHAQAKYLRQIMDNNPWASDPRLLAGAYNSGPNLDAYKQGRLPNIAETQEYVRRVMSYYGGDVPQAEQPKRGRPPQGGQSPRGSRRPPGFKLTPEQLQAIAKPFIGETMDNGTVGCVEAATKIGAGYSDFLKEERDRGVVSVAQLRDDARAKGLLVDYDPNNVDTGDVLVWKSGGRSHVVIADGRGGMIGNSSTQNKVIKSDRVVWEGQANPDYIIKTGGASTVDGAVDVGAPGAPPPSSPGVADGSSPEDRYRRATAGYGDKKVKGRVVDGTYVDEGAPFESVDDVRGHPARDSFLSAGEVLLGGRTGKSTYPGAYALAGELAVDGPPSPAARETAKEVADKQRAATVTFALPSVGETETEGEDEAEKKDAGKATMNVTGQFKPGVNPKHAVEELQRMVGEVVSGVQVRAG